MMKINAGYGQTGKGAELVKIIGSLFLLAAGYLLAGYFVKPLAGRIALLEEGELLFRILESEIRNKKTPLPDLFSEMSRRTDSGWKRYFEELSAVLKEGRDTDFTETFKNLLDDHFKDLLSMEERMLFANMGRNLLSDDFLFQRKNVDQVSGQLVHHISKMKENLQVQKKVYRALCLSMSAMIVIILI